MIEAPNDIADGAFPRDMWESVVDYCASDLPKMRHVTKYILPDKQATLYSLPVTLVTSDAHEVIIPEYFHVHKDAGTGWTVGTSGVLNISWRTYLGVAFSHQTQAQTTAFFAAAENIWLGHSNNGGIFPQNWNVVGNDINGQDLVIRLDTADISGGTGLLIAQVWYRIWPGLGLV